MIFGAISREGKSKLYISPKKLKIDSSAYQSINIRG